MNWKPGLGLRKECPMALFDNGTALRGGGTNVQGKGGERTGLWGPDDHPAKDCSEGHSNFGKKLQKGGHRGQPEEGGVARERLWDRKKSAGKKEKKKRNAGWTKT